MNLVSEPLGLNKPLFDIRRDETAFSGDTELDLSLAEVNPPLARDILNLEAVLAAMREALITNASKVANLPEQMSLLQQLDTELHDLVTRPLDEISQVDLDAILDRYGEVVDAETKLALHQLIDDLKQSVTDLENELGRLIDDFGAQADAAADFATQTARDGAWNPDDPSGYGLGPSDVPWVEVPDLSEVPGAFSAGNDPYAAYADGVIAALLADVVGSRVVERADFAANVRAWRANSVALEQAIRERAGVSLAETRAFLNAQNRITGTVRRFMDGSDWFVDSPVSAQLRGHVDGVLKRAFDDLADQMKDSLNLIPAGGVDLEHTQLFEMIDAFAGGMSLIGEGAQAYVDVMGTLVHATSRIAIGFVPFAGPALDFCECVTGKAWCLPSGRELSDGERIFSGVGFAIAGGPALFRGMTSSGLRPSAMRVVGEIEEIEEAYAAILRTNRVRSYKMLRGAITKFEVDFFEKKAAKFLVDDGRSLIGVGDDGVRDVLGIPKHSSPGGTEGKAPDFLSVSRGHKLIVSEAKGGTIQVFDVRDQLSNAMKALKEKGLDGDVARVELIMEHGATLDPDKFIVKDGYLFDWDAGKPLTLDNKAIMVIRL